VSPSELVSLAIGCTCLALGATSIAAWILRRRVAERQPLWFGIWCVLYGIRLLAAQPPIRLSLGGPTLAWSFAVAFITYSINIPTGLFFESLIGQGWKRSIRRVWQAQIVYAVGAIATDLVAGRPNVAMPLNNPIVLTSLLIQATNVWTYRHRLGTVFAAPLFGAGGITLLVTVVNENLGRPLLPAVNLEPVGLLLFMIALAYTVVGNVVRGEAELVAVQRELDMARQIQRSLLPRDTPKASGLDVAAHFAPMTAVAGDLYDLVPLGPSRLGILVADVSGHGIPAALVASMVKLAFTTAAEQFDSPALVLSAINRALCRQLDLGLVTAVYAVIDTERGSVTVANGGHPPPLLGRRDAPVMAIHEHGLLLGFKPDATYSDIEIALQEDDALLLYTDGVTDARNAAGEFFEHARVAGWLAARNHRDARAFKDAAVADLNAWRGDRTFEDDVTFVVARYVRRPRGAASA
jgi:sigma-B regulation protein RsbU (phosphoserine phosphatase)